MVLYGRYFESRLQFVIPDEIGFNALVDQVKGRYRNLDLCYMCWFLLEPSRVDVRCITQGVVGFHNIKEETMSMGDPSYISRGVICITLT